MQDFIRCHYVSPENVQCGSWTDKKDGELCFVHKGMTSIPLAANGVNKSETINVIKELELQYRIMNETDNQKKVQIYDEHLAKIEQAIATEKMKHQVVKALRSEVIDGMTAEEIQVRRRIKPQPVEKKAGKLTAKMTDAEKIENMKAKHPNMSDKGIRMLLGLD